MPNTIGNYVASLTEKSVADLTAALDKLPEDKRNWSPLDKGRTALDQVAECAVMNKVSVAMIQTRAWDPKLSEIWDQEKAAVSGNAETVLTALQANTAALLAAIRSVDDADMEIAFELPWETTTLGRVISFCYWNMSYHEGQITYINTLLA